MQADHLDTLTVLFTDLVGSTRLRAALGERSAEDRRWRIEAIQRDVVTAERGRVVKGLGDGLMCVFPAAEHALRAAGQLITRLEDLSRRLAWEAQARVGISAGDVRQVEDDVFGTPAIEAARLCAAADGGEILLTDTVRVLAGSWSDHPLVDRGERALKGLPAAVRCWALDWRRLPAPAVRDVGLLVDDEFAFVGREAELAAIDDAWAIARQGARTAVLLAGEAGVGKTRLAIQAAQDALDDGGLVLAGRCDQDTTVPLEPLQPVLAAYAAVTDAATVVEDAGPFAPELARHIVALSQLRAEHGRRDADADAERFRLFAGITRVLRATAQRQPVMIIVDDLQWADADSLAFVEHLLRAPDPGPLCLIATYRNVPEPHVPTAAAVLNRLPRVTTMTLEGLASDPLADLLRRSASDLDPQQLWERTRGHPFFAVELIRRARTDRADGGVPASVRDLVEERAAHLHEATVTLLTVGALVGYTFDVRLAAAVATVDDASATDAIEEAVTARLVLEVPGQAEHYQFTHALVADTFATMPSQRRITRTHAAIAEQLRRSGASAIQVAGHILRGAAVVGIDHAIAITRDAARRAVADGAAVQAIALLERATQLDLSARPALHAEVEIELGECLNHVGRAVDGVPHFEVAARLADELDRFDLLQRAALGCWAGNPWYANTDDTAQRLLRLAIDRCPAEDDLRRSVLRAGLAAFSIFTAPLAERDQITRQAVSSARASGDQRLITRVLTARHVAIGCPLAVDELDEVHQHLTVDDADVPLATAPGDLVGVSAPDFWNADGAAYRRAAAAIDLTDPRLAANEMTVGNQLQACVALFDGRIDDARALATTALTVGSWGDASVGNHMWQLLVADWLDGRIQDSRERAATAYRRYGGQPTRLTHAWTEAEAGEHRVALDLLDRVGRDRLARIPELFLGSVGLAAGVAAVVTLEAVAWAQPFLDALAPIEELMCGVPWAPFPAGAFYAGQLHVLLGDVQAADRCYTRATELHERMLAPAFVALAQAEHGRALLASDRPRAVRLLRDAEAFARDMHLDGILDRAVAGN
jgi:class 3 adenylate cyclase